MKESARIRNEAVARECETPTTPSLTLRFELKKFGRNWMAYSYEGKKPIELLQAPSLLSSALGVLESEMSRQAYEERK